MFDFVEIQIEKEETDFHYFAKNDNWIQNTPTLAIYRVLTKTAFWLTL